MFQRCNNQIVAWPRFSRHKLKKGSGKKGTKDSGHKQKNK